MSDDRTVTEDEQRRWFAGLDRVRNAYFLLSRNGDDYFGFASCCQPTESDVDLKCAEIGMMLRPASYPPLLPLHVIMLVMREAFIKGQLDSVYMLYNPGSKNIRSMVAILDFKYCGEYGGFSKVSLDRMGYQAALKKLSRFVNEDSGEQE